MKTAMAIIAGVALSLGAQAGEGSRPDGGWFETQLREFRGYPHLDRAYRLMNANRLQEARAEIERYLAVDPQDPEARTAYVVALHRLGAYRDALREADALLARNPGRVPAMLYRALALQSLGQGDLAQAGFRAAASMPGATPQERDFALQSVAELALKAGRNAEALAALDELGKGVDDYSLHFRRGLLLQATGRNAEAAGEYARAAALTNDRQQKLGAFRAQGMAAKKGGEGELARLGFTSALELDPANAELMRALADVAYDAGDLRLALKWTRDVLRIDASPAQREFLANLLYALKDYAEAAREYARLAAQPADSAMAFRAWMAAGYSQSGLARHREAAAAFAKAAQVKADPQALAAWAQELESAGDVTGAIVPLGRLAELRPSPEMHLRLGTLYVQLQDRPKALSHLAAAARTGSPAVAADADRQRGFLLYAAGDYAGARAAHEAALRVRPDDAVVQGALGMTCLRLGELESAIAHLGRALELGGHPALRLQLAQAQQEAGRVQEAVQSYRQALAGPGLAPEKKGEVQQSLAYALVRAGDSGAAVDVLRDAIASGRDHWGLHRQLAYSLMAAKRPGEAVEEFRRVVDAEPTAESMIQLARAHLAAEQPVLALHWLKAALPEVERLDKPEQKALYDQLGYLYAAGGRPAAASDAYAKSLALQPDPAVALQLARSEQAQGKTVESSRMLRGIDPATLPPPLRADWFDATAQIYAASAQHERAVEALNQAEALQPQPERRYRLSLHLLQLNRVEEAVAALKTALQEEPKAIYGETLAYAYSRAGDYGNAVPLFEEAIARSPDRLGLYQDLAYLHLRHADNDQAEHWFRRAIDRRPMVAVASQAEAEKLDQAVYGMREEVRQLNDRFDLTLYQTYRPHADGNSTAPSAASGGVVPSQGGVEAAWRLGLWEQRTFQAFGRLLWSTRPHTLTIDQDTVQAGVGVRYKPFNEHSLYVSAEALLKVGDRSENNGLLRAAYGWTDGTELKPGRNSWNYTTLYADLGYFTRHSGVWALYGEARQGWTFNVDNRWLVTPHVMLAGRGQDPDPGDVSYLEGGLGVSFKYLFNESRYETYRSNLELLLQYRKSVDGGPGGWVTTAVLRF